MQNQLDTINQSFEKKEAQIGILRKRLIEDKNDFEQRMKIINDFKVSINENHATIEKIQNRVRENYEAIHGFKQEEVYINSRNCYEKIYQ